MKLKPVKIIIQSTDSVKEDWKGALRGDKSTSMKKGEIVLTGIETLSKIFSKSRLEILQTIISRRPQSIYELAKVLNRNFKNVHSDVKLLKEVGLIDLEESGNRRGGLIPVAKYSGIELDLAS